MMWISSTTSSSVVAAISPSGAGSCPVGRMISYLIANNTCVNSANSGISLDAGYGGAQNSGTRIANNLVLEASGTLGAAPATTGLTFDHNLWSRTPAAAVSSTTDVIGNPLLVDPDHARGLGQVELPTGTS